ncbi:palmitoyl-protein thioesterase 1-like [Mesocricetus auratus]|uniref:Palmitoyl-protein thioesterase 1-like n=1 Tax=Mesocricetus auratus TaxID=10036 RepID=A0ABM2YCY8_MESAU|nr:palmitoyl-protein thioesterase 1-like [Mesocricetus auratus]
MVLRGSWWLLSVCLLSWELGILVHQTESRPIGGAMSWYNGGNGDLLNIDDFEMIVQKEIAGIYRMEDVENNILNVSAQECEILTNDFAKFQQVNTAGSFSKRLQMLKELLKRCPIPLMTNIILLYGR